MFLFLYFPKISLSFLYKKFIAIPILLREALQSQDIINAHFGNYLIQLLILFRIMKIIIKTGFQNS